jgi:hypothetical protein
MDPKIPTLVARPMIVSIIEDQCGIDLPSVLRDFARHPDFPLFKATTQLLSGGSMSLSELLSLVYQLGRHAGASSPYC